mgnify:CR=1 FL=1
MLGLGLIDDVRFDAHFSRWAHPERPERLTAARSGLRAAVDPASIVRLDVTPASPEDLMKVHRADYLASLEAALSSGWGQLDADTYVSPGSGPAAHLAAGGTARLAVALMRGEVAKGFALVRPPGHHAEADRAMGFCLLNNIAIAAEAALAAGAERVAIVDWDVHHGNGTQHAFEDRGDVLFVSLHQWPCFPGTGRAEETGRGRGVGRTVNVALPAGCGDEVYGEAFRRVVLPVLRAHAPDLILVSAGYDAHTADPLASMELSTSCYAAMATALVREADALGHGRVGFVLEGGYDLAALEGSVSVTARAAMGHRTELPEGSVDRAGAAAIEATRSAVARVWAEPIP